MTLQELNERELEQEDNILVEGVLTDQSRLIGKNLKSINFRRRFGAFILAIRREGKTLRKKISHLALNAYDTLLIYGPIDRIQSLAKSNDFILIGEVEVSLSKHRFWWLSITVLFGAVLLAALGIVPIVKGVLIGEYKQQVGRLVLVETFSKPWMEEKTGLHKLAKSRSI